LPSRFRVGYLQAAEDRDVPMKISLHIHDAWRKRLSSLPWLWIISISAATAIMLTPIQVSLDLFFSHPVQSMYVMRDPVAFGLEFYLFLVPTVFLITSVKHSHAMKAVVLLVLFGVIFAGLWTISSRGYIGEPFVFASDVEYITDHSRLPIDSQYRGYPGLSLFLSSFSLFTGLRLFDTIAVVSLIQIVAFVLISYVFFSKALGINSKLAGFCVLLAIQGNWSVGKSLGYIHAGSFAPWILFATLLLLLTRFESSAGSRSLILVVVLAIAISHFGTWTYTFLFLIILSFMGLFGKARKFTIGLLGISAAFQVVWQALSPTLGFSVVNTLVVTSGVTSSVTPSVSATTPSPSTAPTVLEMLSLYGRQALDRLSLVSETTNLAPNRNPVWVTLSIVFWLIVTAYGCYLGVVSLRRRLRSPLVQRIETAGIVSATVLAASLLFTLRFGDALFRPLTYVALFTSPVILRRLFSTKVSSRRYLSGALAIAFVFLSLPTFLAYNKDISLMPYSSQEQSLGNFVASSYPSGRDILRVFGITGTWPYLRYYVLTSSRNLPNDFLAIEGMRTANETNLWLQENYLVDRFENSSGILVFSALWRVPFELYLGISPECRPEWELLKTRLMSHTVIFSDGFQNILWQS